MLHFDMVINRIITSIFMTANKHSITTSLALIICLGTNGNAALAASSLLPDGGPVAMTVDILPDNPDNTIDLGRQRLVTVAIFGSASLNVNDINPRTLSLEATTRNLVGKSDRSLCRQQDIDDDTHMDLICDIKTIGYRVQPGEIAVVINAGTYHRQSLRAEGILRYQVD